MNYFDTRLMRGQNYSCMVFQPKPDRPALWSQLTASDLVYPLSPTFDILTILHLWSMVLFEGAKSLCKCAGTIIKAFP